MKYFERARAALRNLVQPPRPVTPGRLDKRVVPASSADVGTDASSWLEIFEAAVERGTPVSSETLAIIKQHVGRLSAGAFFATDRESQRVLAFLRPRPNLSARLVEMHTCRLLEGMFPEIRDVEHALLAIQKLERILEPKMTLAVERFGVMLGELGAPELLVLSLLLHGERQPKSENDLDDSVRSAQSALDRLRLPADRRQVVEFLIRNQLQMAQLTLRDDTSDPDVVERFAALVGTEERLKMLCLMTFADLGAKSSDTLTPLRQELLWRLFVDTYNQLTVAYGDEVIDRGEAAVTELLRNRPGDISEQELTGFLEGLPRRYLTLFDADSIFRHARLVRDLTPDAVHSFLTKKLDIWELAVVTLDKPYLFSNICGVLAFFGMDILRGYALTSRGSLVVDVFQFADRDGFFEHYPTARSDFDVLLADVVAGHADITSRLQGQTRPSGTPRIAPVIYFDNDSSNRYTVLEVVTDDAPGLLHRLSRVISRHGYAVDLVLISTEGLKAVDVFHMRNGTSKLTDSEQLALTEDLERMLEEPAGGPTR